MLHAAIHSRSHEVQCHKVAKQALPAYWLQHQAGNPLPFVLIGKVARQVSPLAPDAGHPESFPLLIPRQLT